jgi:hypothetical protein
MDVEHPWLWLAGFFGVLGLALAGVVMVDVGGRGSVTFHVTNAASTDPVTVTVERETGNSFERVHRTTVDDVRETAWTATEPGYYEVTLATPERSCTLGVVLEVVDGRLTVGNEYGTAASGCPTGFST